MGVRWQTWRKYRKAKKSAKHDKMNFENQLETQETSTMSEKTQAMMAAVKPGAMMASATTQNSVAGVATGGVSAYGIVALLRSILGDSLPWAADQDVTVAAIATVVLGPIVARIISFVRAPKEKAGV